MTFAAAAVAAVVLLGSACNLTDKAPTVPVISGPSSGVVGVPVTFKATATDPDGDSVAFQFDWGDSTALAWTNFIASGETTSVRHTYADSRAFSIKARAKDKKGKESDWSDAQALGLLSAAPAYPDSVYDSVYVRAPTYSCGMSPDGSLLCVGPGEGNDSITVLRVSDRTLLPRVRVGSVVTDVALSGDNRYVFANVGSRGSVCRVDLVEGRTVDSVAIPDFAFYGGLVLLPDGSRLLTGAHRNIYVLRADSLTILDSVRLPYNVEEIALNQTGTALYVCTWHGIGVVDVPGCSLRAFTQEVDDASRVVLSPDEDSLYVYNDTDSGVAVMRASDLTVLRRVNLHAPWAAGMMRTPDGTHLYVGIGGLPILDTRTLSPVDSINVYGAGLSAMHPSGDSAYYVGPGWVYVIGKRR